MNARSVLLKYPLSQCLKALENDSGHPMRKDATLSGSLYAQELLSAKYRLWITPIQEKLGSLTHFSLYKAGCIQQEIVLHKSTFESITKRYAFVRCFIRIYSQIGIRIGIFHWYAHLIKDRVK